MPIVLPKQHYLIDIPSTITILGPMVRSSCFSFESAHSYFKDLARKNNFKNLPLSLAKRHQFNECCNLRDPEANPSSHPLFSNEKTRGVTEKADPERWEVWFLWSTTWNQIGQRHACIQGELDHTSWYQIHENKCHCCWCWRGPNYSCVWFNIFYILSYLYYRVFI